MDRTDTKFLFHTRQLVPLLELLQPDYYLLEVNGARLSKYATLYYDTDDFRLFQRHQSKGLNRYKIRSRKYLESNITFLEVKFKNNKGRTKKERITTANILDSLDGTAETQAFIQKKTPFEARELLAKLWVYYSRMTLVSKDFKERLTIDLQLRFDWNNQQADYGFVVIAELKQAKFMPSPFTKAAKQIGIRQGSLSKYCLGISSLHPEIKHNNFKPVLLSLNKLKHEHSS
ncbi:MAG: polyphosphate polymerase domain-containing protein [Cytophagaceae bacterium]|nr:polyphosphate polymerase domain-containing protein [Cytophagaceae bacterium]